MKRKLKKCLVFLSCFVVFIVIDSGLGVTKELTQSNFAVQASRLGVVLPPPGRPGDKVWKEIKGKHFVVYYGPDWDKDMAKQLLRKAEEYYRKIGTQIGYTRYNDFWTWDERAKVVLFPDQKTFTDTTGQPAWSTGYADRDSHLLQSRSIVTYKQEQNFLNGLLPHEISHLILHDYIKLDNIPIWFDEGVAQLYEVYKHEPTRKVMRALVSRGQYIPLQSLVKWDIRLEKDPMKVKVFYMQSLSVVKFLVKKYGNQSFARLCRNLRDGKSFEDALRGAYTNRINSISELEKSWINYMRP